MLTVIVICDEPIVEAGLRFAIAQDPELELVGVSQTVVQLLNQPDRQEPDLTVCVLRSDAELAITDLRYSFPRSAIVLLARDFSPQFAHQALNMGVRGFVSTLASAQELADCFHTVGHGELWMEKALSMRLLDSRPVTLSRRQNQLLRLLAQGLKNKEIAVALGIAEGTVKAYLTVLFEKLGAKDRFELALFGLRNLNSLNEGGAQRIPRRPVVPRQPVRRTVA